MKGRIGALDKLPWKSVEPPQHAVERQFIRNVYLGESMAPYRLLDSVLAVIPWDEERKELLNADMASRRGYSHLATWLAATESLWNAHGKGKTSFAEKMNFFGLLTSQFPVPERRVVYSKSGTNPAAAVVRENLSVIDHKLYWSAAASEDEALYLEAILNSEWVRAKVEKWQSMGQWGARDFDKVAFNLPIPEYDRMIQLHLDLAREAAHAETVAGAVNYSARENFIRFRKRVRDALTEDGVASRIERLVGQLLP